MSIDRIKELTEASRDLGTEELLRYVLDAFGSRIEFASSFSAEDQVILDMLMKVSKDIVVFTLDTGRLPEETYEVIQRSREKYAIEPKILLPDTAQIEAMIAEHGQDLFYDSVENRKMCCHVRKVVPLSRELTSLEAWICGLRSEQSVTRSQIERIAWDETFSLVKICPLSNWTNERVWQYIRDNDVPYNKLHDKGYPSIGCEPCSRPIKAGDDIRAGRWWWEKPEHKECGLHLGAETKKSEKGK